MIVATLPEPTVLPLHGYQTISAYNIYFDKKRIQNNLAIDLDYCIFSINLYYYKSRQIFHIYL